MAGHNFSRTSRRSARKQFSSSKARTLARTSRRIFELLEDRKVLAVNWIAGGLQAPLTNRVDNGLGNNSGSNFQEPYAAIDPTDPGNVVFTSHAGARLSTNATGTFTGVTFPNVAGASFNNGDTSHAFDAMGRLFWTNLVNMGGGGGDNDIQVAQLNPTTGAQIGTTVNININSGDPNNTVNDNDDKQIIAADANPASPFANNLYMVWSKLNAGSTIFFSRSIDQGANWSVPIALSGAGEGFVWPSDVAVAANGDVYVAYHSQPTFNGNDADGASGQIFVRRSTDGGVMFGAATSPFTGGQADITFNVQGAGREIPNVPVWTQGSAQPWILPDPARPGNVYVITSDDPTNGAGGADIADMVISRSIDNGATWSAPAVIPDGSGGSHQMFPAAQIDRFGNIALMWYDDRSGALNANNHALLDVFATYSVDGGLTWAPAFQINDTAFNTDYTGAQRRFPTPQIAYDPTDATETSRIGEYFAIEIFGGTAYVGWNGHTGTVANPTGHQLIVDAFALNGSLVVTGDDAGTTDDDILIRRIVGNTDFIEVLLNGQRQYAGLLEGVGLGITVNGLMGTDTLTIDNAFGIINVPFTFDGGLSLGDNDRLVITGNPFSAIARETYLVGVTQDAGIWVIDPDGNMGPGAMGAANGDELIVTFVNLEPIDTDVPAAVFDVVLTTGADNVTVVDGGFLNGATSLQVTDNGGTFETFRFANKTTVRLFGNSGADQVTLDYTGFATGLTDLDVYGHAHPGVLGVPADDAAADTLAVLRNGAGIIHTLFGNEGDDNFTVGNGDLTQLLSPVHIEGDAGGGDSLVVDDSGRAVEQDYLVNPGSISLDDGGPTTVASYNTNTEFVRLNGTQGANEFHVTPGQFTEFFIDGNDPSTIPGDFLDINFVGTEGRQLTNVGGNGMWEFSNRQDVKFEEIEQFNFFPITAIGAEAGLTSRSAVRVYDAELGDLQVKFFAYGLAFKGGVRVAVGDITGDGIPEIITAPGPGRSPLVKVFDLLSGTELYDYRISAYESIFLGGVYVATGDVTGDGLTDIITSPGPGRPVHIRVWENEVDTSPADPFDTQQWLGFRAFGGLFIGGATVAAGDLNGDGRAEIVVGNGPGMGPRIRVYDIATIDPLPQPGFVTLLPFIQEIRPFRSTDRGGVFVAVGNVRGDGLAEIIAGNGIGGRGRVEMFNADGTRFKSFNAYDNTGHNPAVHVAVQNVDADAFGEVITGEGPGSTRRRRSFEADATLIDDIFENDPDFRHGFFVA